MTKCFECLREEYYKKIKWREVQDAIVILEGKGYCYKHLVAEELEWKGEK